MAPTLLENKKKKALISCRISLSSSSHQESQLGFFSSVPKFKGIIDIAGFLFSSPLSPKLLPFVSLERN